MNIAIIVCRFKPYKGGISNMAYDQALGLAKLGHQVTVFTPFYEPADEDFKAQSFTITRIKPLIKYGNAAFIPELAYHLAGFDVIHLHYPFFGGAEVVWLTKILAPIKAKLVITYHMDVVGAGWLKSFFYLHNSLILPSLIKQADKVIITSFDYAESSNIKAEIQRLPEKFTAIPPAVDLTRFYPADKDTKLMHHFNFQPEADKILLFVGALDKAHYFKGLKFLIESFIALVQIMPQLKLLIVGGGELQVDYQKQVADAKLNEHIFFSGSVSDFDLPKYYNLADLAILPSVDRSEAFGLALIEAMACAKPVIAANLPGVRSVFSDGQEGFVFNVNEQISLANSLARFLNDDNLRLRFGQAAREKAANLYNQDKLILKLEQVYQELLKK